MSSVFRTTQNVVATQVLENLQQSMAKMQNYQLQLSSGKRVAKPSDDPSAAVSSMLYRSDQERNQQYVRNSQDAVGWLGTADSTLTTVVETLGRIRDLMLQAANGTQDTESRTAIAKEISTAKQTLIGLANATYQDRPIFAGTANPGGLPVPVDTYDAAGNFNGNTDPVYRTIGAGAQVQINLSAHDVFGTPGSNDMWSIIDGVISHLTSGSELDVNKLMNDYFVAGLPVKGDLSRLDALRITIQNSQSEVGARIHRVEQMQTAANDKLLNIEAGISNAENVDLAKTITDMNLQSASYQAALSATARVIQTSLVDFLR